MLPICIQETGKYGRGIYAARDITNGVLIEKSPVIVSAEKEWNYLKMTILHDYCFSWGEDYELTALALGYGSLINHSYSPNVRFIYNLDNQKIDFYAMADIQKGEEITINYNDDIDDKSPLWFDVLE